jgi:hypothetical protein
MKVIFILIVVLSFGPLAHAQEKATLYGDVLPTDPTANGTATGTAAVLSGATQEEENFLKALAAAPKKGRFICDNLDSQPFAKIDIKSGRFEWSVTSDRFPVNQTLIMCGKVTITRNVRDRQVEGQYMFSSWESVQSYANLKTQVPPLTVTFVDHCPASGWICENSTPIPDLPVHKGAIEGYLTIFNCDDEAKDSRATISSGRVIAVDLNTVHGKEFYTAHRDETNYCDIVYDARFPFGVPLSDGTYSIVGLEFPEDKGKFALFACVNVLAVKGKIPNCNLTATADRLSLRTITDLLPDRKEPVNMVYIYGN